MQPKNTQVYIAGPLFNPAQITILEHIELMCEIASTPHFSPRLHSEPYLPPPEDRAKPEAWDRMFGMNVNAIEKCGVILAVLNYAMPDYMQVGVGTHVHEFDHQTVMANFKPLYLPDSGTVWEMGYARGTGRIVVGFHPDKKPEHLNLMLTHGTVGMLCGWDALETFLKGKQSETWTPLGIPHTYSILDPVSHAAITEFDWSVAQPVAAQQGGGEA